MPCSSGQRRGGEAAIIAGDRPGEADFFAAAGPPRDESHWFWEISRAAPFLHRCGRVTRSGRKPDRFEERAMSITARRATTILARFCRRRGSSNKRRAARPGNPTAVRIVQRSRRGKRVVLRPGRRDVRDRWRIRFGQCVSTVQPADAAGADWRQRLVLADADRGATDQSSSNTNGSPATSSAGSAAGTANIAGNDLTEQMIHMQAKLLTPATTQSLTFA
jgi:hypothetical protein